MNEKEYMVCQFEDCRFYTTLDRRGDFSAHYLEHSRGRVFVEANNLFNQVETVLEQQTQKVAQLFTVGNSLLQYCISSGKSIRSILPHECELNSSVSSQENQEPGIPTYNIEEEMVNLYTNQNNILITILESVPVVNLTIYKATSSNNKQYFVVNLAYATSVYGANLVTIGFFEISGEDYTVLVSPIHKLLVEFKIAPKLFSITVINPDEFVGFAAALEALIPIGLFKAGHLLPCIGSVIHNSIQLFVDSVSLDSSFPGIGKLRSGVQHIQ